MQIHLLDMGQTKYGDCILITSGERSILVDGGHEGDAASIRFQLSRIFKKPPPFDVDLLVVTHCHSDHIGCLPELVQLGQITPRKALVADEKLGFGIPNDDSQTFAQLADDQKGLVVALQEENQSDLPDEDLEQFIYDAGRLVDRYTGMLSLLEGNLVRYGRDEPDALRALENDFSDFGLKILGPTIEHLLICAEGISMASDTVLTDDAGDGRSLAARYRSVVNNPVLADNALEDRPGTGAARNNQSIVLSVAAGGFSALLAGDMQFAKAEVAGLNQHMAALLDLVNAAGPYDLIKLSHHSSYDGLNETMLKNWLRNTSLYVHTGGRKDPGHPDKNVLKLLSRFSNQLHFARTDRNGLISVTKTDDKLVVTSSKSQVLNDFETNQEKTDEPAKITAEKKSPGNIPREKVLKEPGQPATTETKSAETYDTANKSDFVEVITRVPHVATKVTITIEVDPVKKKPEPDQVTTTERSRQTPDPRLSGLLFITCQALLSQNLSATEAGSIMDMLAAIPGADLLNLEPFNRAEDAAPIIREKLGSKSYKAVVIIGGYDVVPSQQLSVIDESLRSQLKSEGRADADNFIVWCDDIYGDRDGDFMPELPVSRIPDAKTIGLIQACLRASAAALDVKFGLRNFARPFADLIYPNLPGTNRPMEISEQFGSGSVLPEQASSALYYMLHGSEMDSTRFWGERKGGRTYEALHIDNLPHLQPGSVVFTGCCWGALTVLPAAYRKTANSVINPKHPGNSIALKYLQNGALAFVGCTGSHYSPVKEPFNAYGKPMHDYFWQEIRNNKSPAAALFHAKMKYATEIPHNIPDAFGKAAEVKILHQYTCLGLGW